MRSRFPFNSLPQHRFYLALRDTAQGSSATRNVGDLTDLKELPPTQRWPETGFFHPYIWLQPAHGLQKPGFLGGSASTTEE